TVGLRKLDELIHSSQKDQGKPLIKATELAKLYDTFGTPIDLMYVILSQGKHKLLYLSQPFDDLPNEWIAADMERITEERFRKGIEGILKELQSSKLEDKTKEKEKTKPVYVALSRRHDTKSLFKGYDTTRVQDAKVIALVKGDLEVKSL